MNARRRPYEGNPSQFTVLEATHGFTSSLAANEEVIWRHAGEDGWMLEIELTRCFTLREQQAFSGGMQDWVYEEICDLAEMEAGPDSASVQAMDDVLEYVWWQEINNRVVAVDGVPRHQGQAA